MSKDGLKPSGMTNRSNPGDGQRGGVATKGSVNDATTRKTVAPTPKTIGPRTA